MRYLPLIPAKTDPQAWAGQAQVELWWTEITHPGWLTRARPMVHALHFRERTWDHRLIETAAQALAARLEPDFLVFSADMPKGRKDTSAFLGTLTALLEATHSRGVKLALRPLPGTAPNLAALLKEIRGEAVGFCWDGGIRDDLDAISDRLFASVGKQGDDLAPLLRLGYRWNLAIEAHEPVEFEAQKAAFEAAFPPVLFPAELPTHALGRPVLPDPAVTFGPGFGGGLGR